MTKCWNGESVSAIAPLRSRSGKESATNCERPGIKRGLNLARCLKSARSSRPPLRTVRTGTLAVAAKKVRLKKRRLQHAEQYNFRLELLYGGITAASDAPLQS
jgi:hypothetical protein